MTTWLDEAEKLAKAATPGPWATNGRFVDSPPFGQVAEASIRKGKLIENAAHIATWSPDRVLLVIAALRAAKALTPYANAEFVALRAALAAALETP